jgi:TetR/AcrR family transcriptional regulator, transcriptional repressor for nem operon
METRELIMAAARLVAQAHGYGGLNFRDLAKKVGIKSASIHYYFPTKGDLGAALAKRYTEDAKAILDTYLVECSEPSVCLRKYTELFRKALENGNRMCLCGFMAAESDDLPDEVKAEVKAFGDMNVAWLDKVLARVRSDANLRRQQAMAIFSAVAGAQLTARIRSDIAAYDTVIETYRKTDLILIRDSRQSAQRVGVSKNRSTTTRS